MIVRQRYGKVMQGREGEMIVTAAEQTETRESSESYCNFPDRIRRCRKNNGGLKVRRREETEPSEKEEAERSRGCECERGLCFP